MIILKVLMTLLVIMCWFLVYLWFKMDNAYENQMKLLRAIELYLDETGDRTVCLEMLDSMESMNDTLFRLWDWGYKNILPKEYLELLEPYIG